MKRYYQIALVMLLTLSMFSCTELEEEPIGLFAPEGFFKSETDVETMINGAYGLLSQEKVYGRKIQMTLMLASDMVDIGDVNTAARRVEVDNFSLDSNNGMVTAMWPELYRAISTANSAIEGAESLDIEEDRKNELIGEARTIRALVYYHLVQLFGDLPLIVEAVSNADAVAEISRTPAADVWAQIIEDCKFGMEHLPLVRESGRSRATSAAAKTLLASCYLTLGDWANAAKHAEELINNAASYELALVNDYQDLFNADKADTDEAIWVVDFLGGVRSGNYNLDYFVPVAGVRGGDDKGWSVIVPSPNVYDSFDDNDYRKSVCFLTEQYINGELKDYTNFVWPRIHMRKWNRFPGANAGASASQSDHNYFHFRYAEVLLIAAEALNELNGPSAKAFEYVNRVRERARFNGTEVTDFPEDIATDLSQEEFRAAVREERRVELAFEWKRWYDMRRWDNGDITAYFNKADSYEMEPNVKQTNRLFPVPQSEIDLNENLLPQNSGY